MFKLATLFGLIAAAANATHQWTVNEEPFTGTLRTSTPTLCDASSKQLSGYFDVSGTIDAHYFFWMFEARKEPSTAPFVIWLTGGPGCSSMLAMLTENGPCTVNDDLTTKTNSFSWTESANVMWVDQPTGVGYSYGDKKDYVGNEDGVGEHMYQFLQAFFKEHPEYAKNDFYVTGESYGGHFVPAVSHRIWAGNQKSPEVHINLKGLAIGNGLVNPEIQYGFYAQMAYNNTYGVKAVNERQYESMVKATPSCINMIHTCNTLNIGCTIAESYCGGALVSPYSLSGLNVYDVRRPCGSDPLCYNFDAISTYLNSAEVKSALGVTAKSATWETCSNEVHALFNNDWMHNFSQLLPEMLASGIRVLDYAGDADFICNWMGNRAWSLGLDWTGKAAFNAAGDHEWMVDGVPAGKARSANGLTFLQVYGAGHMVPMDQPKNALDLITRFTSNQDF